MSDDRPRDTQRKRLYDAEREVRRGQEFKSVAEMQQYVDALLAQRWCRSRWGGQSVEVRDGRGFRRAMCYPDGSSAVIYMPLWSRCQRIVLHEVAHALAPEDAAWHGPEFAAIYLALVQREVGADAAEEMRAAFRKHRVRHRWAIRLRQPGVGASERLAS